jgi:Spy/CpxP family protein refolding chaperone
MRTHPFRFAALVVAMLALGAALSAQGPGPRQGRGFMGLHLTEAQQAQVKAIHERHQTALKAKQEAAQAARKSMHEAMANAATDAKTLQALHEKASAAQFDLMLEHRAVRAEIVPLLTPEQKAQFEKRGPGFGPGQGMGPRGGRGRGPGMNPGGPMNP